MANLSVKYAAVALALACSGWAQTWEIGAAAGYGRYKNAELTSGGTRLSAGIGSGIAFGGVAGHNMYEYVGGEARYTYRGGDLRLSNGTTVTLDAESHAIHYDLLIHGAPRRSPVRPFLAVGGGIKYFRGTGTEPLFQPLSEFAVLTRTTEVKPLISLGAGVKVSLSDSVLLRLDFRDYMTRVPTDLIAPRRGASVSGWLHDFVPMVGIGFQF
jgi:hypothetical protein